MIFRVLMVALCLGAVCALQARFDNYKVYRVKPDTQEQLEALRTLHRTPDGVKFWGTPRKVGSELSIMVPPHKLPDFQDFVIRTKMGNRVTIENLQEKFDNEKSQGKHQEFGWTSYHDPAEINAWLDSLAAQYPHVTSVVGGRSFEGREIRGVKVSYKEGNPGVFIEAGIHANEWIGPATATYVLNQVLTTTDPVIRALVEGYDWYVFPSFNPDGFEYTHTTDRTWRKTRSDGGQPCRGVDLNRNWGFHWMDGGSSNDSCSVYFAGTSAYSENEAQSLSDYISTIGDKLKVYLAFHSFSQMFLLPYGHTNVKVSNYDQLMRIGNKAADKLAQRHGTNFTVGNIVDLLYVASGGSADWVKGTFNTPVVMTLELRDTGDFGYYLPPELIIPSGEETFDAVLSILEDARGIDHRPHNTE